jgi:hypothetical protein
MSADTESPWNHLTEPWEKPGSIRCDFESHRGGLIHTLGIVSLIAGIVSLLCAIFAAPVGLAAGIAAWWMAAIDLTKMRTGTMHSSGRMATESGRTRGIIGSILSLGGIVLFVALFVVDALGWGP